MERDPQDHRRRQEEEGDRGPRMPQGLPRAGSRRRRRREGDQSRLPNVRHEVRSGDHDRQVNRPRGRPRQLELQNEGFNALQDGCNLERNLGHGKENLASVLPVFILSAFTVRAACRLQVRAWLTARREWAEAGIHFQARCIFICTMLLRSWDEPMEQMASGRRISLEGPRRSVSENPAGTPAGRSTPQDHRNHALKPGKPKEMPGADLLMTGGFVQGGDRALHGATPGHQPYLG